MVTEHSPKGSEAAAKTPRPAGRPRSEGARRAVLDAAYTILVEAGLTRFSTETVALRSGVARSTIYRWWPSKGLLAIESFLKAFRPQLAYAESGDAVADFRDFVDSLARALSGPAGKIAASVVAQAQSDPETGQMFLETFSQPLRHATTQLLTRGVTAGRLRVDLNLPLVLDATVGAVYLRLLLGQPIDAAWSRALSETILRGCLAGAPDAPSPGPMHCASITADNAWGVGPA